MSLDAGVSNRITDTILGNRFSTGLQPKHQKKSKKPQLTFFEFFCGGGMARAGLGPNWKCLFANDFDPKKSLAYISNWGGNSLQTEDVGAVKISDMPGRPSLVWASFPCQDLSLAGMGAGLRGDRSGTFWPFWDKIKQLKQDNRAPNVVVLENVCGTLTSHQGKDFKAISNALASDGYQFGAVVINAVEFVPQSRPRLFIIAVSTKLSVPKSLKTSLPDSVHHTLATRTAYERLSAKTQKSWVWWKIPKPPKRNKVLGDLIEKNPTGVRLHTPAETEKLIGMMSLVNLKKLLTAKKANKLVIGAVYKRTRLDKNKKKVQRAEVRFDNIAGCLRTAAGGSSRQVILLVNGDTVRSRLLSIREAARLMGLPDSYKVPANYNEAYHLLGDGVAVPVVRHLAQHLIEPLIQKKGA